MKKIILLVILTTFYTKLSAQLQPNGHTIKNLNWFSTGGFPIGSVFQVYPSTHPQRPAESYVTAWSGTVEISKNFGGNRWYIVNFTPGGGNPLNSSAWIIARTAVNTSLKVPCGALWELNATIGSNNGLFTPSGDWRQINFEGTAICKPKTVLVGPKSSSLASNNFSNTAMQFIDPDQITINGEVYNKQATDDYIWFNTPGGQPYSKQVYKRNNYWHFITMVSQTASSTIFYSRTSATNFTNPPCNAQWEKSSSYNGSFTPSGIFSNFIITGNCQ
jgi:hypothetical protein